MSTSAQSVNACLTAVVFLYQTGGQYAGVDTLKTRLLPWLGTCFSMARPSVSDDTSLQFMQVTLKHTFKFTVTVYIYICT